MDNAAEAYLSLFHCINNPVREKYKNPPDYRIFSLAKALATFCVSKPSDEGYAVVFQQLGFGQRMKVIISGTEPELPVRVQGHLNTVFQHLKDIVASAESESLPAEGHTTSTSKPYRIPPHTVPIFVKFIHDIISFGRERTRAWMDKYDVIHETHNTYFGTSSERDKQFMDVWERVGALKVYLDVGDVEKAVLEMAHISNALSDKVLLAGIKRRDKFCQSARPSEGE